MFKDIYVRSNEIYSRKKTDKTSIGESQLLLDFLEGSDCGDYINTIGWSILTASEVKSAITRDNSPVHIIDIRGDLSYLLGHIKGSVNKSAKDLIKHYTLNNLANKEKVILVCSTGQKSAYFAGLLQLYGFKNVYSMKYGMSSWHNDFNIWKDKISDRFLSVWDIKQYPHPEKGELPVLKTGFRTGSEILEYRIKELITEGFGSVSISSGLIDNNLSNFFVASYMSESDYLKGHLDGAVNYAVKSSLKSSALLKTLPAKRNIALYSYTGQTSAYAIAFLRLMGYDAKSVLYGANGMAHQFMIDNNLPAYRDTECMDYSYVK